MSLRYLSDPCIARIMTWLDADELSRLLCTGDAPLAQKMRYAGRLTIHFGVVHPMDRSMDKSLLAHLIMESAPLSELNLISSRPHTYNAFSESDVTKFVAQHQHTLTSLKLGFHKTIDSVLPHMPELKSLEMSKLSSHDRASLVEVMPRLKSLTTHRITHPEVNPDMTNFRRLTTLNLGVVIDAKCLDGFILPLSLSNFTICMAVPSFSRRLAPIIKQHPTPFLHFALELPSVDWAAVPDCDLRQFVFAWQAHPLLELVEAPSNERLANWLSTNSLTSVWFTAELKDAFANVAERSFGVSTYQREQWTAPLVVPAYEDALHRQLSKGMHIELQNGLAFQCMPLAGQQVAGRRTKMDDKPLVLRGFVIPHQLPQSIQPTTVTLSGAFGDFRVPYTSITHLDINSNCISTKSFMLPPSIKSLVIRTSAEMSRNIKSVCKHLVLQSVVLETLVIHYDLPRYFTKPFLRVNDEMLPGLKHLHVTLLGEKPYVKHRFLWPTSRREWPQRLETFRCAFSYTLRENDRWANLNLSHLPPSMKCVDIKVVDAASARRLLSWASRLPPVMTLRLTNFCNNDLLPHLHDSMTIWLIGRLFGQDYLFRPKLNLMDVLIAVVVVLVSWLVMFIFRH